MLLVSGLEIACLIKKGDCNGNILEPFLSSATFYNRLFVSLP